MTLRKFSIFLTESPFGPISHSRAWQKQATNQTIYQTDTAYSEKDSEFVDKIRFYQEIMNKRVQRGSKANGPKHTEHFDYDKWDQAHFDEPYEDSFRNQQHANRSGADYDYQYAKENAEALHKSRAPKPTDWHFSPEMEARMKKQYEGDQKRMVKILTIIIIAFVVIFAGIMTTIEMYSPHRIFREARDKSK